MITECLFDFIKKQCLYRIYPYFLNKLASMCTPFGGRGISFLFWKQAGINARNDFYGIFVIHLFQYLVRKS